MKDSRKLEERRHLKDLDDIEEVQIAFYNLQLLPQVGQRNCRCNGVYVAGEART